MRGWVYNPHTGGKTIPKAVQDRTRDRILAHAGKRYGKRWQIDVRFRGALCYVDAFEKPDSKDPLHLVRLRYFGDEDRWTIAFFTYSHEKYEPSFFASGEDHGTPEEGFDVGSVYLDG